MKNFTGRCFKNRNNRYVFIFEDDGENNMLKAVEIEPETNSIRVNNFLCYRQLTVVEDHPDKAEFTEISRKEFKEMYDKVDAAVSGYINTALINNYKEKNTKNASVITPREMKKKIKEIYAAGYDEEAAHFKLDTLYENVLRQLGYGKAIDELKKLDVKKYYA